MMFKQSHANGSEITVIYQRIATFLQNLCFGSKKATYKTAVTLSPEKMEALRTDKKIAVKDSRDKYHFWNEVKMGVLHCLYKYDSSFETGTEGLNF
jgi:hypothetical protein